MTRATRCAEYTGPAAPCLYLAFELGSTVRARTRAALGLRPATHGGA
jgi:hypothetical protein